MPELSEAQRAWHEQNRRSWNLATAAHNSHKPHQGAFLRDGGLTLFPEERALCGDVRGLRLLHLLCNSGQDTLSFARLGAEVTGVDISDTAIDTARRLSDESGLPARFEHADVYDFLGAEVRKQRRYDRVFLSYGALLWVSDLASLVRDAALLLQPGGALVIVDFHPVAYMFDESLTLKYPYSTPGVVVDDTPVGDYVAQSGEGLTHGAARAVGVVDFENPEPTRSFAWGTADLVTAVVDAGLTLEVLTDYPYTNGCRLFTQMRAGEARRWYLPASVPAFPLMFGLRARRD